MVEEIRYEYKVSGKENPGTSSQNPISRFYVCHKEEQARRLATFDGIDIIQVQRLGTTRKPLDARLE